MISDLLRHRSIDSVSSSGAVVGRTHQTDQSGLASHLPFGFVLPRFVVIHIILMPLIHLRDPMHTFLTANDNPSSAGVVRVPGLRQLYAVVLASKRFSCICTSKLDGRLDENHMVR